MVKVSDLVAEFLKEKQIEVVFGIIGSANSHIFNSINDLGYTKIVNTHHEQAAVMAMGAYYRASGKLSASIVTAGGGASNAVTGIVSNWADSIPGIIISGNESSHYIKEQEHLRMYGTQGFNISKMVQDVTKYSHCLLDENDIQNQLEVCYKISNQGRKGPVLLDIPFDIQSKTTSPRPWLSFNPKPINTPNTTLLRAEYIIKQINKAKKPLILGGNGIRLSGSKDKFNKFLNQTKIPTTLTWSGIDLLASDNDNFYGRFGLYGQRASNFIVQNCDLLIVLGSRLALPQTGYDYDQFVREGKIIIIDIDTPQYPLDKIDGWVQEDCSNILDTLLDNVYWINDINPIWKEYCNNIRIEYPWIGKEHNHKDNHTNSYQFIDKLSNHLKDDHIIVTDMGTALLSGHQAIKLKPNQTMFTSLGLGEMGYGIAGAIGAAMACPTKDVLCLNCDGGIMMNLQELHTIIENGLNVKVVIFNNDGYLMIKHTQKMLFKGNYVSVDKGTGIGLPNFSKLLPAFGYDYFSLKDNSNTDNILDKFLNYKGPAVLEVFMDPEQGFLPKVKGVAKEDNTILAPPIEEMSPLVSREQLENSMLVKLSEKSNQIQR
jgi:acetolactate synthase-1/2/3 large subunit